MTTEEAVTKLTKHVLKTGVSATDAVRALWAEIVPISDADNLIQYALASLVSVNYKRPSYTTPDYDDRGGSRPGNGGTKVAVRHESAVTPSYNVTVSILHDVHYNVNGRVTSVAMMNRHDLITMARKANRFVQGWSRYQHWYEQAADQLAKRKKATLDELAEGDKTRLARAFSEVRSRFSNEELKVLDQ